jgi:hypothetical protein
MHERWLSGRAVLFHLVLAVFVPGCWVAMWWQVHVALSGNALAWAYSVEWPVFSVLAVAGWWQLIHEDPAEVEARRVERRRRAGTEPSAVSAELLAGPSPMPLPASTTEGAETADLPLSPAHLAYNAHLSTLAAAGRRKTWRNPQGFPEARRA